MMKMNSWDWLAMGLVIVGGLNWGLIGLFDFDLVAALFGFMSVASRIIYTIVGLGAVYAITSAFAKTGAFRGTASLKGA